MTMPIILHYFGQLSLVAPLANLGVIWAVPPVMEVLGPAVAVGLLWDSGGWLISMLAWPGLKFMLVATTWFAGWPGANLEVEKMSWIWVGVYYLVVYLGLWQFRERFAGSIRL